MFDFTLQFRRAYFECEQKTIKRECDRRFGKLTIQAFEANEALTAIALEKWLPAPPQPKQQRRGWLQRFFLGPQP